LHFKIQKKSRSKVQKFRTEEFDISWPLFDIYGVSLTPPFAQQPDMEEPYDLRVEDLARHPEIPETWLKCGSYTRNYNFNVLTDIFIDTATGQVYACEKNQKEIVNQWSNLDECFCSIYHSFDGRNKEYDKK
jgi:hypothetical protein